MSQKSDLQTRNKNLPWLQDYYNQKKKRTYWLVKMCVDTLLDKQEAVTIANIANISKSLDPEGKGIHPNTIRNNTEAHAYYAANSLSYRKKRATLNSQNKPPKTIELDFNRIKPDRDLENLRRRYRRYTKAELIEKILIAEQYIVENQQTWLVKIFEEYDDQYPID